MKIKILIIIIIVLFSIPLVMYFSIFNGNISQNHTYWMEFSAIWSSLVGTLISTITIIILVSDRIKNSKNQKQTIFQQQIEIYYKLLEKLTTLYPAENNNSCFKQFINKIEEEIRKNFDINFYNYYADINIIDWPISAYNYFINKTKPFFNFKKEFPDEPEGPWFSAEEKNKIAIVWHEHSGSDNRHHLVESLKYYFGRPLEDEDECLDIFSSFIEICGVKNYNIKNLYIIAFENAMQYFNNNLMSYFKVHINALKALNGEDDLINTYLSMISGDEKAAIIYFLLNYNDYDITNIHLKYNFITDDITLFCISNIERIKELLKD